MNLDRLTLALLLLLGIGGVGAGANAINQQPSPTVAAAVASPSSPSAQDSAGPPPSTQHPAPAGQAAPESAYPDPDKTPGAYNPDVSQDSIESTICVRGWTATVRPPVSYTNDLKAQQMAALGLPGTSADYEEDHFVPLELGGSPTDPRNLWPQPWTGPYGAHLKDKVENYLHAQVCAGAMPLDDARHAIQSDWYRVFQQANL